MVRNGSDKGGDFKQIASMFGIEDENFRGGARASVGDPEAPTAASAGN